MGYWIEQYIVLSLYVPHNENSRKSKYIQPWKKCERESPLEKKVTLHSASVIWSSIGSHYCWYNRLSRHVHQRTRHILKIDCLWEWFTLAWVVTKNALFFTYHVCACENNHKCLWYIKNMSLKKHYTKLKHYLAEY